MKTVIKFVLFTFMMTLLSGCGGLPKEEKERARSVEKSYVEALTNLESKKQAFSKLRSTGEWDFFAPYSEKEKWESSFEESKRMLSQADKIYQEEVLPLLDRNEGTELDALHALLARIRKDFTEARRLASIPSGRKDFLLDARSKAPEWVAKAKSETAEMDKLLGEIEGVVSKAKADYAAKKSDLDERIASHQKLVHDAHTWLNLCERELEKVSSGEANYANLGDSAVLISGNLKSLKAQNQELGSKVAELYRSYSKTLIDMRIEYFVEIGRTSWDAYSDWPTEHEQIFKAEVDSEVFDYFDSLTEGTLATYYNGKTAKVHIEKKMWDSLSINPGASWPSGDDDSEFWVNNTYAKTYHRYTTVENKTSSDSKGWVEVSEDIYWAHEENLGLTIVSKPYGVYEEEVIKSAAPPGMEYIATPKMVDGHPTGSNEYGRWERNSSGGSFWAFYGQYTFMSHMLGGNRYGYNDWDDYNRRGRSSHYYGRNNSHGTYGAATYNNKKLASSNHARRNPGAVRDARSGGGSAGKGKPSVRGGGSASRGRGAGGGGK